MLAKASYKKTVGTLELTRTHLQWISDGKQSPSVKVPLSEVLSLFCSKEGAAQVRLKVGLVADDAGHNFTFTSAPQSLAVTEREQFKNELTNVITRNRSAATPKPPVAVVAPITAAATPITATIPSFAAPSPAPTSNVPRPSARPSLPPSRPSMSRGPSLAPERRMTPVIAGTDPATDFRQRVRVLRANPELGALHRDLVTSGEITEAEFWDGREHLLLAQAAVENQKKGKSGQLVDPRPETVEGGEIKIRITPQLVHDIFDEYPVVAKAYKENVPKRLSEEEFWKRYFQSKLFNAHRASIRSTAAQHVGKDDPILDKYLEKDDDELEPRNPRTDGVDLFVDLGATLEDHGETGNEKDVTMQAGRERGALPLIRKFNKHSERLLNSALGEGPPLKKRRTDADNDHMAQLDLDDLHDPEASNGILLEMQDRQRYFEGRTSDLSSMEGVDHEPVNVPAAFRQLTDDLEHWDLNLAQLRLEKKPSDAALISMTHNVAARLNVNARKNELPETLFKQMKTCQTAANEFLRQFWSSVYPPIADPGTLSIATPAQRASKAEKMIGYLAKTEEKVNALIRAAQAGGIDPTRVETAMKSTTTAVERAMTFNRNRKPPR